MTILKSNPLLLLLIAALIGFFLMESELLVADPADKVTESKVEQAPEGEEATSNPIKLQDKIWYGKIGANETKQLELNLLFPDEGKFFMEIEALAYDKNQMVWKTLGQRFIYATTKKGEEGKVEIMTKRPKVTPFKMKPIEPITRNPWESSKSDTIKDKSVDEGPKSPTNPKPSWQLRHSMRAGKLRSSYSSHSSQILKLTSRLNFS